MPAKTPRIVVPRLMGGLGNQMFIYAHARALAERAGAELRLDRVTGFARDPYKRRYELGAFRIEAAIAGSWASYDGLLGRVRRTLARKAAARQPLDARSYLKENGAGFDAAMAAVVPKRDVYVEGYWQCPRYFDAARPRLLQEFALKQPTSAWLAEAARIDAEPAAVCVHFRSYKEVPSSHGVPKLTLDYYQRAIAELRRTVSPSRWLVFSDDLTWARSMWPSDTVPVEFMAREAGAPERTPTEEMLLMARARHFITANSTFSWWAAWLGAYADKRVVAPSFVPTVGTDDIVPSDWTRLA